LSFPSFYWSTFKVNGQALKRWCRCWKADQPNAAHRVEKCFQTGQFVGDGVVLRFDFGRYSNPLKEEKKPVYVVVHKSIGGFRAKVVSPSAPGHGITACPSGRTADIMLPSDSTHATLHPELLECFEIGAGDGMSFIRKLTGPCVRSGACSRSYVSTHRTRIDSPL